jgi:CheY-like chemotaxis protein
VQVVGAQSRRSAIKFLEETFFDLVILDLEIPTEDDGFDLEVEHGQEVFYHAKSTSPGTPVYILTGSEPDAFLRSLVKKGQSVDLWGDGILVPTVAYYLKEDGEELLAELKDLAARVAVTDAIRINTSGQVIELSSEQKRALKVFTRSNGGNSCRLKKLGGLSNAIVLRITVIDSAGRARCECVGKLGLAKHVRKEITAYESDVKHLKLGAFAPVLSYNDQGLRGFSGVFYALADDTKTFFDFAYTNPEHAVKILTGVKSALSRWSDGRVFKIFKVADVRRHILSDEKFNLIIQQHSLQRLLAFEERDVELSASCIHGDLHGGNILVNAHEQPVLIDFGDVGDGLCCLDPLTLELSFLFHPDARSSGLSAYLEPSISHWLDREKYACGTPFEPIIKFCREWAYEVGPHDDSIIIMAYLFVLKQLKYETVPSGVIIVLLDNILSALE